MRNPPGATAHAQQKPAPSSSPPDLPWWKTALRNLGIFSLIAVGMVIVLVGVLAVAGAALPSYTEDVLLPAQDDLAQGAEDVQRAQAAAKEGDYDGARQILEEAKRNTTAFVEGILDSTPPGPLLEGVHEDLKELYGTVDDGIDLALDCLDDLENGTSSATSAACVQGNTLLSKAPAQGEAIRSRLGGLLGNLLG